MADTELFVSEKLDPAERDKVVVYFGRLTRGDLAGALKSYRDCLAIREKLAKQDPTSAVWQADLAYSYWCTGFVGSTLPRRDSIND